MKTMAGDSPATRGGGGRRQAGDHSAAPGAVTNVNEMERIASAVAGGALAVWGAQRRDLPGTVVALIGAALLERAMTGHCRVYGALGLDTADDEGAMHLVQQHGRSAVLDASRAIRVERTVTVGRPADELYRFWRNFENLPRIMDHLESVTVLEGNRSHWKAKAPAGQSVEWHAEIHNEIANRLIAWRSVDDATVPNAGSVHFTPAPGGRGTEIKVVLEYAPPGGRLGAFVAKLFGEDPDTQVREDLRRFKATMETGEIPTTEGQSSARHMMPEDGR